MQRKVWWPGFALTRLEPYVPLSELLVEQKGGLGGAMWYGKEIMGGRG